MNEPQQSRPPKVYVTYRDTRKDISSAESFGQLVEMFSGAVKYDLAVGQARRMLHDYRDGDHILGVGDPALLSLVTAVALEFSETGRVSLLRWDRDEVKYRALELDFDVPEEDDRPVEEAQVVRQRDGRRY